MTARSEPEGTTMSARTADTITPTEMADAVANTRPFMPHPPYEEGMRGWQRVLDALGAAEDVLRAYDADRALIASLAQLLAECRTAIEPLTTAQIKLHRLDISLAARVDAALSRAEKEGA